MPVVYVFFKNGTTRTFKWASNLRLWASRSRTAVEGHWYGDVGILSLSKVAGEVMSSIESLKPFVSDC